MREGKAYPCFMTVDEINEIRQEQEREKLTPGIYGKYAKCRVLVPRWPCVRVLTETDPAPARLSPVTVPDLSDADPDAFLSGMSDNDLPS